jgi:hypothetical protein
MPGAAHEGQHRFSIDNRQSAIGMLLSLSGPALSAFI